MNFYITNQDKISGTNYAEVKKQVSLEFKIIKKRTRRNPYIRSRYFNKQKIFLNYYWDHLMQKNLKDRTRRLKFFNCAVDLIINSPLPPTSKEHSCNRNEILHRFAGKTKKGEMFFVQIKEEKKNGRKYFLSCFPIK